MMRTGPGHTATPVYTNVAVYLSRLADAKPYQAAIYYPSGKDRSGRVTYSRLNYRQLDEESNRIARGLLKYGFSPGMRTALMVTPSPELFMLTFAMLKNGVVPVMVDPGMGASKLKTCFEESEIEGFIGIPKAHVARMVLGWGKRTVRRLVTVFPRGVTWGSSLRAVRNAGSDTPFFEPMSPDFAETTQSGDLAAVNFTSGSTGIPKGVEYTHGIFSAQVELIRITYGIDQGEIDLCTFPLFALFAPALGMTSIIPDMDFTKPARVNPENIVRVMADFGPANMFGSPALLNTVGRFCAEHKIRFPSLRRVICAGAPIHPSIMRTFAETLAGDARIHSGYGATEAMPLASIDSKTILEDTAAGTADGKGICVGTPNRGIDIDIIPITDEPIPEWTDSLRVKPGEIGEITVRGAVVTQAYFRRDDATRAAKIFDPETGRFRHRMGDLGWIDDRGRIWFCGRKSHRVRTVSGDLFTVPVEGVFNAHPDVYRTALVGLGDPGKEIPVLCVELEPAVPDSRNTAGSGGRSGGRSGSDTRRIIRELGDMGRCHPCTRDIRRFIVHPSFPVDIRHNSKIFREKLREWVAARQNGIICVDRETITP
jgi:olefin beta-lactone synthetase